MSILIKNVLCDGKASNIFIDGNRFKSITESAPGEILPKADKIIDGTGKAILPPFYNAHNHAAMSIMRGLADDLPLKAWLEDNIWPREDSITADEIYRGSKLAILEMIKSGTVFFSDMYFEIDRTIQACEELGVRAAIGITVMDAHPKALLDRKLDMLKHWDDPTGGRIQLTMAPHAVYTVGTDRLRFAADTAREHGVRIHIHASETATEVSDCIAAHGMTPVAYLESLGFLGPDVIVAHGVHVNEEDMAILKERGVTVAHCPCSNMKLSSGVFPYRHYLDCGPRVALATDGCASNNNQDMGEEMKIAALFAKAVGTPEDLPASEILKWATVNGAEAYGIDAGVIAPGKLADAILVDLGNVRMHPCINLVSNWVYSADSECIDTVICDGRVIMENRYVPGEEEIIAAVI